MEHSLMEQHDDFQNEERLIGYFKGKTNQPTLIIISGIHGNEYAGVRASEKVVKKLQNNGFNLKGNLFFVYGNRKALKLGKRFIEKDLNRIWDDDTLLRNKANGREKSPEEIEQYELYKLFKKIFACCSGPFYFIDLHTTSAQTFPFITISDSLNNRKFSSNFPLPTVLGIEEYLQGTLLTYMNEFGHVALGFEAGQHDDEQSVQNCEAFIWLAFQYTKTLEKQELKAIETYKDTLFESKCENKFRFFEIIYRYAIKKGEDFEMRKGFENFETIKKGQVLAKSNGKDVRAISGGQIFMPLYQKQGDDGFFIINRISHFWIKASIVARKWHIHNFLRLLPGVKKYPENDYTLIVNPRTARFLTKEIFHLFGYRQKTLKDDKWLFIKRDRKYKAFI